jgi:hypothetical protein
MSADPDGGATKEHGVAASIETWRAARKFPATYPGDRPAASYLLSGNRVHSMILGGSGRLLVHSQDGPPRELDEVLAAHRAAPVDHRYRVVAYGANRNPATLHIKLRNYRYQAPGPSAVLPALRAVVHGADVVACGLHGQGYLYGDLLMNSPITLGTSVEAWVLLLDHDQLRVLNDSEGVGSGMYSVGLLDDVEIAGTTTKLSALGYFANRRVLTSPVFGAPLGFASVAATGRRFPSMSPIEMLEHLIESHGITRDLCAITGLGTDGLAASLMKYLNGQWWYHFNTGDEPIEGYTRVLRLFADVSESGALATSNAANLAAEGKLLTTAQAYTPPVAVGTIQLSREAPCP